ncbi:MAG: hypothetical protein HW386_2474, partial [Gammaproteobacteria bacterium]|nr:hypothetical protein [Gammaproteobacteria bacterium]
SAHAPMMAMIPTLYLNIATKEARTITAANYSKPASIPRGQSTW